jgi:hypothetical protein
VISCRTRASGCRAKAILRTRARSAEGCVKRSLRINSNAAPRAIDPVRLYRRCSMRLVRGIYDLMALQKVNDLASEKQDCTAAQ